jgi:HPt (histidine-containing phosphotransfer) domain-containing protein
MELKENNDGRDHQEGERISNLDYLNELSNGNPKFVKDMIALFLTEIPQELRVIENGIKGIKGEEYETVRMAAHKLKSTIPFVGIERVIKGEVLEMEKLAAEKKDIARIEDLFKKIKKTCEKAAEELQE